MKTAPACAMLLLIAAMAALPSCVTAPLEEPAIQVTPEPSRPSGLDHPNLRRFPDHAINQIIITAWEHYKKGNFESAALDFERLLRKSYVDDDILFGAGISWHRHANPAKALAYCSGAIEKNPAHFEALLLRAEIQRSLGRDEKARTDLEKIASMEFVKDLVCGLYFDENDLAGRAVFDRRKARAKALLAGE